MNLLYLLLLGALSVCQGYRILGVFPFHGKSHFMMFGSISKGLARRGHQVDVISAYPLKEPVPNYTDLITLKEDVVLVNNMTYEDLKLTESPAYDIGQFCGNTICQHLRDPRFKELLKNPPNDPPYDLVLVEVLRQTVDRSAPVSRDFVEIERQATGMKLLGILPMLAVLAVSDGYRILGIFAFDGKSHFVMFERLMKGLAARGHQVDVISTYPLKQPHPNYTDVVSLPRAWKLLNNMTFELVNRIGTDATYIIAHLAGNMICDFLGDPGIQRIAKHPPQDPPYDLAIIEIFGAHCFAALGHILKVPVVGVSSSILYPWSNDMIANPENLAFAPSTLLPYSQKMNFWERTHNFLSTLYNKLYFNYLTSEQDEIIRKNLGPGIPGVRELESKIAMVLTNSHLSLNGIKPITPALIEVGGLHVQEEGVELPKSLEKWMNESTDGFVYFTFGSMVKIESFPAKYLDIFYESLGKIAPIRVLMKIPNPSELPPGLPKNIHILPWIPQVKVLKHKNIKAFITHGGLMGTQEAVHYGVPLIGIPLFADQFINIDTYVRQNIAIGLDLETLTVEKMDNALNTILKDPKYKESVKRMSRKFLDRPLSAMDTAIYWIEYIVRHGADALRSPALDMSWWQVELFDVYLFLLLVSVSSLYLLSVIVKFAVNLIISNSHDVSRAKKVS